MRTIAMEKILFVSIWQMLESQEFVKPTKPLLETCAPFHTTKTMHTCSCSNQHGSNKIHQARVLCSQNFCTSFCGLIQIFAMEV
jgi:hypothetical protein